MTPFGLAIVGLAACLLVYGIVTSAERLLREVRHKLSRNRKPHVLHRQVQSVTVHEEGMADAG